MAAALNEFNFSIVGLNILSNAYDIIEKTSNEKVDIGYLSLKLGFCIVKWV